MQAFSGIPQGSVLSVALLNICLNELKDGKKNIVKYHSAVSDFKYIGKQDFKISQQIGE